MSNSTKVSAVQEVKEEGLVLKVKRELIEDAKTKSGDDMYSYVLREVFKVQGQEREFRVEFTTKGTDFGGYDMLDIIFMVSDEAYLRITEDVMVNTETGESVPFKTYEIFNEDDDGVVYAYKVKPSRDSDKAKLDVIIQKKKIAAQQLLNKKEAAASGSEGGKN